MRSLSSGTFVAVALLAGLAVSGCATKGYVNDKVAVVEGHVQQVERTAQEALDRANAAHKLAEGKFLYQVVLQDDSTKFPFNRWDLSPEQQSALTAFADKLKSDNRNVYVEIQGHTDAIGSRAYNDKLGLKRAEAVRKFLNSQGVALNRMDTISYGKDAPVAPNDTPEGRAQNRRVVLVVLN